MTDIVALYVSRVQQTLGELWSAKFTGHNDEFEKDRNVTVKQYCRKIKRKVWRKPEHDQFMECQKQLFERNLNGVWKLVRTKLFFPWTKNKPLDIQHLEVPSRDWFNKEHPLVLLHGYGPPSGTFCRIINDLTSYFHIYAIDWLGWGGSSKPEFWPKTREEAEDWYVESLEKWREAQGIKQMNLCGHSLGGYMAAVYALKYPDNVSRLVLLSPVGVPEKAERLFPTKHFRLNSGRMLRKIGVKLWTRGYTPYDLIQKSGPVGLGLTQKYIKRRFSWEDKSEKDEEFFRDFEPYFYNSFYGEPSGFACLNLILSPGAWAYAPLVRRIESLRVPVDFIYGEYDWMNVDGAHKAVELLKSKPEYTHEPTVTYVSNCGHHLALTNPSGCATAIIKLFGYPKKSRLNLFFWKAYE